jgi:hypothetical protein
VSDLSGPDDAPAVGDPWAQGIYWRWEQDYGLDRLVGAVANQLPLDEFLWHAVGRLRQVLAETQLRLSSRFTQDAEWLGTEGHGAAVHDALDRIAGGCIDILETVGLGRMTEIGQEIADRMHEAEVAPDEKPGSRSER